MCIFFFNDTPTTEICSLSQHDALPISDSTSPDHAANVVHHRLCLGHVETAYRTSSDHLRLPHRHRSDWPLGPIGSGAARRSEEHTSELQSRQYLVCRLLLEKKKSSIL